MSRVEPSGILTLTTDFGAEGPYVAALKGVVLGLVPGATLVDVSHAVSPQNVLEGAFLLASVVDSFPAGTVHLGVVDPGVGTDRRLLAVRTGDQWLVLPDNGMATGAVLRHGLQEARAIDSAAVQRGEISPTFHGRDILAPAAAHLVRGGDPAAIGREVESITRLTNFQPREDQGGLVGEVIYRDPFGNLVTNVPASLLRERCGAMERWCVTIAGAKVEGLVRTYADRPSGTLVSLTGSSGWVEIAVTNGDAGRLLAAGPGTTVWFRLREG